MLHYFELPKIPKLSEVVTAEAEREKWKGVVAGMEADQQTALAKQQAALAEREAEIAQLRALLAKGREDENEG